MSEYIKWLDDDRTILHLRLGEAIQDGQKAITIRDEAFEMIKSVSHTVYRVVDLRGMRLQIPADMLRSLRGAQRIRPDNMGMMVLIGSNLLMELLLSAAKRGGIQVVQDFHYADSIEDAVRLINEQRTTDDSTDTP